jgi:Zn-dependent peptidase ImmA (M78 family)
MAGRVEALVKPELLIWARQKAGLDLHEAAKKVAIRPERLQSWEAGETRPTVKQLRKLGHVYKRPLAIFYLADPPLDFDAMRDYRRLPGHIAGLGSTSLRLAIRQAQQRREIAIDLQEDLELEPLVFDVEASLADDPPDVATRIRNLFGITYQDQTSWGSDYEALNQWREAFETTGILVFQATAVDVGEMRGFSISQRPLPTVVVNIKDAPRGRIFTMLHELTHILLHQGGLCDLEEEGLRPPEEQRVEIFCNRVAGETLVPTQWLLNEPLVQQKAEHAAWSNEELNQLASRYRVSWEVILRRLLMLGRTTLELYREKREEFHREWQEQTRQQKSGFAPPHRIAISTAGPHFVRLVLNSYYQERITASDLAEYLGVRLKHLERIEREVFGHSTELGAVR